MAKRGTLEHPKTTALARRLGIPVYAALGLLEALWHLAARYAGQGDVGRYADDELAAWLRYDEDAERMVDALVLCGWLDPHPVHRLVVHDWHEHMDQTNKKALQYRKEKPVSGFVVTREDRRRWVEDRRREALDDEETSGLALRTGAIMKVGDATRFGPGSYSPPKFRDVGEDIKVVSGDSREQARDGTESRRIEDGEKVRDEGIGRPADDATLVAERASSGKNKRRRRERRPVEENRERGGQGAPDAETFQEGLDAETPREPTQNDRRREEGADGSFETLEGADPPQNESWAKTGGETRGEEPDPPQIAAQSPETTDPFADVPVFAAGYAETQTVAQIVAGLNPSQVASPEDIAALKRDAERIAAAKGGPEARRG